MNNYNIYLEIRNPKKQAMDTKLEAMACYLMNQRPKSKGTDHGAPPGRQSEARVRVLMRHGATVEQCSGHNGWRLGHQHVCSEHDGGRAAEVRMRRH